MANEFVARKGLIISGSSTSFKIEDLPTNGSTNQVLVVETDGTIKSKTGASGTSGSSGSSGTSGSSGSSGTSGSSGSSGTSGSSGSSGTSGSSGSSGTSGSSGSSGTSGSSGSSGTSGSSGSSGTSGSSGSSGTSGSSGSSGTSGSSGSSGTSGSSGSSGTSGSSGSSGTSGSSGSSGTSGSSGSSGTSGSSGSSGTSGSSGSSGTSGSSGSSGTSGSSGSSGTSGSSGSSGTSGSSGSSGTSGSSGSSGTSGSSGSSGTSGSSGSSGTSGSSGSSGTSGSSGSSGTSGSSGSSGTSGSSGSSGTSGSSGSSGVSGVTTIVNDGANRVLKAAGDGTINAQEKLTFSNSDLLVHSTTTNNSGIEIFGGSVGSAQPYISPVGALSRMNFGDGSTGHIFDFGNNKIAFDSDSTNTFIQADTSDPENLEIHAHNDIELFPDNDLFVQANGGLGVLRIDGQLSGSNQSGTYFSSQTGAGAGDYTVGIGEIANAGRTWIKVDGETNIILSQDTETVTFDGTNGLVATTDIKGPNILGTSTTDQSIRGYGKSIFGSNGVGTIGFTHQFYGLSAETATFTIFDKDGEETFKATGSIADGALTYTFGDNGEAQNGNIFTLDEGNSKAFFNNSASNIKIGINQSSPDQELHVVGNARFKQRHYVTEAPGSAGASEGEVVTFGAGTTVAGKLYHYNGTGWNLTNANPATSAATSGSLVAMALGTSPTTNGMLLRGIARPLLSGGSGGKTVYFDSAADGQLTTTVPTTSGYIVRIAGHCLDANTIYFNPSPDWIVLA